MEEITVESTNIDTASYANIKAMLQSSDRGNATVALAILEQADLRKCLPYILMVIKEQVRIDDSEWDETAPKLKAALVAWNISVGGKSGGEHLSFKRMLELTKNYCEPEGIQFLVNKYAETLSGILLEWGIDIISELDLTLKLKK